MDNKKEKNIIITSFLWKVAERFSAQFINLLVSIILARILEPSMYGQIAMVTIIISILQVFIDSGLGSALIQKKNVDDLDYSSVFFFNIIVCSALYMLVYWLAPYISAFFNMPKLTGVIKALGLLLIISGVKNIQHAYVSRNMLFKTFFCSTIAGTIISAFVGIWMAYNGYGIWALVSQQLINSSIDTIILWITVKWRPKFQFSFSRLKSLFSYGWKLLISALLDSIYNNLRQLLVGKIYSADDLAYYNQGEKFPKLIITNIDTSINSVLFPAMSKNQEKIERVKNMTRRAIMVSTYLITPLMLGLCFTAETFVRLVFTQKWIFCVPYLCIFSINYILYPIHTANINAIKAMGRSDIFLKLEIVKKVVGLIIMLITMPFGPFYIALGTLAVSLICQVINCFPNKALLDYSYFKQLKDIIPGILLSCFMGAVVYCVSLIGMSDLATMLIQIFLGAIIYIGLSWVFRLEAFYYLIGLLKGLKKER